MKKTLTKILTALLVLTVLFASVPVTLLAEGVSAVGNSEEGGAGGGSITSTNGPGYIELTDGYIKVRVSTENGGFYIGTDEGDVLTKSDNGKDLVYSASDFDTSFTSFRVKRGSEVSDYIFGRDYSFRGKDTSEVTVIRNADNAITAEWTVDGILFRQVIALMGADTYQHGMAYISYSATNTSGAAVDSVEARVMMDTALGTKDYGYYMLGQNDGSYVEVRRERTVSGSEYYNYFFAYDDLTSPTVTAYTLNASVAGEMIVPSKVTFAHWGSLAATVFDYQPPANNPADFTEATGSIDHLTADSAVALYYDMGGIEAESEGTGAALYYGVYSNYNAGDADVALNYTTTGSMFFNNAGDAYKDINGSLPGNFSTTIKVQNIKDAEIKRLAVAIYPEEQVIPHDGSNFRYDVSPVNPYYKLIDGLKAGETRDVRFDMRIDPTVATGYRKIRVVVYNVSNLDSITLNENNTVIEDEIYVLCPGAEGASVGFTGMTPDTVFHKGTRICYVTGSSFGLIRDKSQYRILLRPANGGEDVVLDMDRVVINTELNMATLVIDQTLSTTTYQVVIDWNDLTVEDMLPEALKLTVTDVPKPGDPGYVSSGMYGIVTIERDGTSYDIVNYPTEQDYLNTRTATEDIMLVMRGDFNVLSTEEQGRYKAEALTLLNGEHIIINDTLEVKNGRVTVTKRFEGDKQVAIDVDIDGKVYTVGANTKVWDGVLAITSFDEGTKYSLPVYNEQGEKVDGEDGKEITLLWPGAAGGMQTLVGLLLNFRYGQFCLMEQGGSLERVISFGAALDPSILVPPGIAGDKRHYSKMETQYRELGLGQYTAQQLRATDTQYAKDQSQWRREQIGTLNLYMDDILFGAGGFIGFNTSIEVGIPSYTDPLPYIEGTLSLKVINDYWEFGVEGRADMMVFEMEVELALKSYNGIPVPDTIRFFVGGIEPGIPIDPFMVFWVKGAGAGITDMYESFFGTDVIPPLTLIISGEFALFSQLSARADLSLSMRGIEGYMRDVSIAGITLIDSVGGSVYWYPDFSISFAIRIDILDCIIGEGGIILEESDDGFYFCAYASATVKIPDFIWFIGGTKIGSAAVGISTEKVWASVSVIGIAVGIRYYWGESVKVDLGESYDVPTPLPEDDKNKPKQASYPIYTDERTGKTLYMRLTTLSEGAAIDDTQITTSSDGTEHSFTLPENSGQDALIGIRFTAENAMMAEDYKNLVTMKVDGVDYPTVWYNNDFPADHEENIGTNAIFIYDEESKIGSVSLSVTDDAYFGKEITLSSGVWSTVKLMGIERVADLYTVSVSEDLKTVSVSGKSVDQLSEMKILAETADGAFYLLAEVDPASLTESGVTDQPISIPLNMPSGDYTVKAVGTVLDSAGEELASPMASATFTYVNPDQPKAPASASITLSGDYTVTLTTDTDTTDRDGFVTTVWEVGEGGRAATVFVEQRHELGEQNYSSLTHKFRLGGRTSNVSTADDGGEITTYVGLEAGKKYSVSVQTFVKMEDGSILLSDPVFSNEVMMVMPTKITPEFSIDGSVSLSIGDVAEKVDTVRTASPEIRIGGVEQLGSAYYRIGDGAKVAYTGGSIRLYNLESGIYTVTLEGVSKTNDAFSARYQFSVDTEAPALLLSSPTGGGFFDGGKTTVIGSTEAYAKVEIYVEGELATTLVADGHGAFEADVALDESLAYQSIRVLSYDAVGNVSMPFGATLTNSVLGAEDLKPVILYGGREIDAIVSGEDAKQLRMAFRSGDRYVTLNEGSAAASSVVWSSQIISKSASVSADGVLTGDSGAEGIVMASLGGRTAVVELITVDLMEVEVSLDIPEGGLTYTGEAHTPSPVFGEGIAFTEGVDYVVSYVNNVDAGVASAIISATADGKCVGTRVISFTVSPVSVETLKVEVSGREELSVSVKFGEQTLTEGTDYTLEIKHSPDGSLAIVTVTGIGSFDGTVSVRHDTRGFDHLTWIIPVATVGTLGIAFGILMLLKYLRRRRSLAESLPKPDEKQGDTPEGGDEGQEE
ncbi:MAG: hypothetical protein IKC32_01415 [Clostridia bacterium]|nr:hypothetical protein [Clostridia bacterium]